MPGENLVYQDYTVVASPTDDGETVIGRVPGVSTIFDNQPVYLHGWALIEPDADTTAISLTVRRGGVAGHIVDEPFTVFPALNAGGDNVAGIAEIFVMDQPGNAQNATYVVTATLDDSSAGGTVIKVYVEARVG